jgi:hypothetical protein
MLLFRGSSIGSGSLSDAAFGWMVSGSASAGQHFLVEVDALLVDGIFAEPVAGLCLRLTRQAISQIRFL